MSNVKIGANVYNNVDTVKLKNADNEAEYVEFVSKDEKNYPEYIGFYGSYTVHTCTYSHHTASANTKYYFSNVNYNQFGIYNRLVLIALPDTYSGIEISNCKGYLIVENGQSVTGTLVWGFAPIKTISETTSNVTLGCDATGPYILFPAATKIGAGNSSSAASYSLIPYAVKINDIIYHVFVESGGDIINRNKSPISYSSSASSITTKHYITQYEVCEDVTNHRDVIVDAYNKDESVYPKGWWINNVLNSSGTWHRLFLTRIWQGSSTGNAYFSFGYMHSYFLPLLSPFKY